jgi:hypothetical protein
MVWGIECEQACVDGINGSYCSLTSETCSDPGTSSCSGESIDFCNDDGMLFVHECDRNGLTCDDSTADCVADGCSSSGCTERCVDEHVVEFCVGGAQIQLDCTEYGFAGCVEQSDGDYGLARCTFGLEVAPAE